MVDSKYVVLENYDPNKKYKINIQSKMCSLLSMLEKGDKFAPREFYEKAESLNKLNGLKKKQSKKTTVFRMLKIGLYIGLLKRECVSIHNIISFDDFCAIPEVQEWLEMLNPSNVKNLKQNKYSGTRGSYANKLHHFHVWLIGKEVELSRLVRTDKDTFVEQRNKIKLDGVVNFLRLYQERGSDPKEFKKIIKEYLHEPTHNGNFKSTMNQMACSIKSFFEKHDSKIDFSYNRNKFKESDNEDEENEPSLNLEEFLMILTTGKPSIMEKSIFMSKFQGGMDSLTLADRFNFNAYPQIVKYFGTEVFDSWDLSLCPVPIKIVRPKTKVKSLIMQDYDAIVCLQKWLKERKRKTGESMKLTDPIYINQYSKPISESWIERAFFDLSDEAGLQEKLKGYDKTYKKKSHLVRDLLESTLTDCGVPDYVAEQFISHAPISKYQNRKKLYPEGLREEYKKASKRINIFSKVSQSLSETTSNEELKEEIKKLKDRNKERIHIEEKKEHEKEQASDEAERLKQVVQNQGEQIKNQEEQMRMMQEKLDKILKQNAK